MIKHLLILMTMLLTASQLSAQGYDELWKQADEAARKDLPKTQMEIMEKIVKKAQKGKEYGQLLKAQLKYWNLQMEIAPDSLKPVMERLEKLTQEAENKDAAYAAVMNAVTAEAYLNNEALGDGRHEKGRTHYERTFRDVRLLAQTPAGRFEPMVEKGDDSKVFNHDLLSLLGRYAARNGYREAYRLMHDYYDAAGMRVAAMLTAADMGEKTDSLIERYKDLPECGYLAEKKTGNMFGTKEKLAYADYALQTWPTYRNANYFRNLKQRLTCPQYDVYVARHLSTPSQTCEVTLRNIRNLDWVKMRIWNEKTKKEVDSQTHHYTGKQNYELFRDTLNIPALPLGRYSIEFTASDPGIKPDTLLYNVSNITVISEDIPKDARRYIVVDATTGAPVAGAKLEFKRESRYGKKASVQTVITNEKGEYVWKGDERPDTYRAYTAADQFMPACHENWSRFTYYEPQKEQKSVSIYTDRMLYRPGQTVHATVLAYVNRKGVEVGVRAQEPVTLILRDANGKEVGKKELTTDSYGAATADFELPVTGLTGMFTLRTNNGGGYQSVRVEEYKRPTYEVTFDEVKTSYKAGDTLTVRGVAKSYAGVPVQGAKVKYKVERRRAFWWWAEQENAREMADGELETDGEGAFEVPVPLILEDADSWEARFYNFVVKADVTDQAGESRNGSMTIPIGTRPTALDVDLPKQVLKGQLKTVRFSRRNASGEEIDGDVTYTIDGKQTFKVKANTEIPATDKMHGFAGLSSGSHLLKATCGEDSIKSEFVVFSLDDKRPPVETSDWFYQSANEFGDKPVSVIVGSSDEDVTVFYSVFSGNKELEHGSFLLSNSNRRIDYTYKEAYGSGLLLTYAWVKNSKMYTHRATISKPLPDKRLITKWTTFRDRLTPGQQETWTLQITHPDGTPAKAQLLATLFDKSLDQLYPHRWGLSLGLYQNLPNSHWMWEDTWSMNGGGQKPWKDLKTTNWDFSRFTSDFYLRGGETFIRIRGRNRVLMAEAPMMMAKGVESRAAMTGASMKVVEESAVMTDNMAMQSQDAIAEEPTSSSAVQLRENLNETAFFYPAVETDAKGVVSLRFTLPESITTWRFIGLAHDREMNNAIFENETVAKKDVMVQPNAPRFVREGDAATVSTRIMNTTDHTVSGTAKMQLLDPETEKVIYEKTAPFSVKANETASATFDITESIIDGSLPLLICRVMAEGKNFSDGEQHYLPVLPNKEQVMNTIPFTQHNPGTKEISLSSLVPSVTTSQTPARLTVEYTNSPAWLMVQSLPFVSNVSDENAISLAAAYYANSLGKYILNQSPRMKSVIAQWQQESDAGGTLQSALEKNQELKTLMLDETPWIAEAQQESEQKKALANFFRENTLNYQLNKALEGLKKLQNYDGSFSWWKGMSGSPVMTGEVIEFLTRLNLLTSPQSETKSLLDNAYKYLGQIVVKEVKEMKQREKEKKPVYIHDSHALQWVYLCAVGNRKLSADETMARDYLMKYLEAQIRKQSMYAKALMSITLFKNGQQQKATEYLQSLMEYTVYTEEKGRYYDTPRAGYSWCDYRIPTQTAVIEALQIVNPADEKNINEMRRWLLQEKRTQVWDTPINSVNAIFAFLNGQTGILAAQEPTSLKINGKDIDAPKATAGLGYVKTTVNELPTMGQVKDAVFTAEKTSEGTSWGALYLQFMQPATDVDNAASGMKLTREIVGGNRELKVGDKISIRLTIEADRDYDFVQLIDKRAACLEPVRQLSGYHWGYYTAPKDNATHYYFDRMRKGKHVIETEYYVDRAGTYQTGICTVQCAYSPEYTARAKAMVIKVK